jgi:hypothetical protein
MHPPIIDKTLQNEGKVLMAMQAVKKNQISSVKAACETYDAPRTTYGRPEDSPPVGSYEG